MTEKRKRIRRPKPERTAPIRDFSTILGERPESRGAQRADGTREAERSFSEAIADGARLGYSVIEEQIRRGRRVAQNHGRAQAGAQGDEVEQLMQRLAHAWTDLGAMLLDLMGVVQRTPLTNGQRVDAGPPFGDAGARNGSTAGISIDIEAPGRSKVDLDLGATSSTAGLVVPALYSLEGNKPLTEISFEARTLLLKIPNDQPAGTYTGIVVDRKTNRPRGSLTVELSRSGADHA